MFKFIIYISVMNITNGMVLEKLKLEGELETVAWLENQQRQNGVTSATIRAFQFRQQQCQIEHVKILKKTTVANKVLLDK